MPAKVQSRKHKTENPRASKSLNQHKSWIAKGTDRSVMAALEWDSIYGRNTDAFDSLMIEKQDYIALARSVRLQPGESLSNYVLELGLGVSPFGHEVAIKILSSTLGPLRTFKALVRPSIEQGLIRALRDISQSTDLLSVHVIGPGKIFFARCARRGNLSVRDDNRMWEEAVVDLLFRHVPGLSSL